MVQRLHNYIEKFMGGVEETLSCVWGPRASWDPVCVCCGAGTWGRRTAAPCRTRTAGVWSGCLSTCTTCRSWNTQTSSSIHLQTRSISERHYHRIEIMETIIKVTYLVIFSSPSFGFWTVALKNCIVEVVILPKSVRTVGQWEIKYYHSFCVNKDFLN